jgi:hypothetical protein
MFFFSNTHGSCVSIYLEEKRGVTPKYTGFWEGRKREKAPNTRLHIVKQLLAVPDLTQGHPPHIC